MAKRKKWIRWAPIDSGRCVYLDDDGDRCRKTARWCGPVFVTQVMSSDGWVNIEVCNAHATLYPTLDNEASDSTKETP